MSYTGSLFVWMGAQAHSLNPDGVLSALSRAVDDQPGWDLRGSYGTTWHDHETILVTAHRLVLHDGEAYMDVLERFTRELTEATGAVLIRAELRNHELLQPTTVHARGVDYDEASGVVTIQANSDVTKWDRVGQRLILTSVRAGGYVVETGLPYVTEVIDLRPIEGMEGIEL